MRPLRVWAPAASAVDVALGMPGDEVVQPMVAAPGGWWEHDLADSPSGTRYGFRLAARPDGDEREDDVLADPRASWLPDGVHGRSAVYDHAAYPWTDDTWRGTPLAGAVLYELHVGTFTDGGTFDAVVEHLDHLVDLGVTAVELLPVNSFIGPRGWGYDGVGLYAPHEPYGGPDGLKRLVDACHARGLGVVLDVVYNHLGPSGNHLARFGPYFTDTHHTPWGDAVNYDAAGSDEVRRFVLDNVAHWVRDFHIDGLRLDAVHAIVDETATHLLEEMAVTAGGLAATLDREVSLIAESDLNDPRLITPREAGGYGLDGQWTDDVHHALHSALTGETQGYYVDFGPLSVLAKAMTRTFVHDGTYSTFRDRRHGRAVPAETPGWRFVTYLQDHDQIGNRAVGDRITTALSPGLLAVGAALNLCSPYTPMLFMGEEWGARTPWQYFTSHPEPELAEAVRHGRRAEFASHGWAEDDVPDPQALSTFEASRLDWSEPAAAGHAALLRWHRTVIALRRRELQLGDADRAATSATYDEDARWFVLRRSYIVVVCNLAPDRAEVPVEGTPVEVLASSAPGFGYAEGSVTLDGESVVIARLLPRAR